MNSQNRKKAGYEYKRENLYTAIFFYPDPFTAELKWAKYHNIEADKLPALERFKQFVKKKFPGAQYLNLYTGISKKFSRREQL